MDHGYFTNAHDSPHWLRITKNKHCQNILQNKPADRYERNFKQDIQPWKKNGSKILVLPPTNAIANFFGAEDWLNNTLKILKENTDRVIEVREKPYNPTVAIDHVGATVKIDKPTKTAIEPAIETGNTSDQLTFFMVLGRIAKAPNIYIGVIMLIAAIGPKNSTSIGTEIVPPPKPV